MASHKYKCKAIVLDKKKTATVKEKKSRSSFCFFFPRGVNAVLITDDLSRATFYGGWRGAAQVSGQLVKIFKEYIKTPYCYFAPTI